MELRYSKKYMVYCDAVGHKYILAEFENIVEEYISFLKKISISRKLVDYNGVPYMFNHLGNYFFHYPAYFYEGDDHTKINYDLIGACSHNVINIYINAWEKLDTRLYLSRQEKSLVKDLKINYVKYHGEARVKSLL